MTLIEMITQAPWREAKTYAKTWPHEYIMSNYEGGRHKPLFKAMAARMRGGEAVETTFFTRECPSLFIGGYKYWFMSPPAEVIKDIENQPYVLNRCKFYRDRRDFQIKPGDTYTSLAN